MNRTKLIKGLAIGLSIMMTLSTFGIKDIHAQEVEISGEQNITQEEYESGMEPSGEITIMDEEGNISVVEDSNGIVESSQTKASSRAATTKVVNFKTKDSSATTSYKEVGTGASGYTNGSNGADAAYLGKEDGKVKFMLSGVVGLVAESEVQIVNLSDAKSISYYIVQNGRLWHRISFNMTQTGYSALDQGPAPSYLTSGKEYYSYDGHYFYKEYDTMLADYTKNTRSNAVNPKNPFYNYYQFLPLRSETSYSDAKLTELINAKLATGSMMKDKGSVFNKYQDTYGANALLVTGIAANESAWGISNIAKTKNNLFGLDAIDSAPGENAKMFSSVNECIRQFAETYMSKRYLRPSYTYYHGGYLGNKASGINVSYASDPYWGEKAASAAWTLDRNGGNKDYGRYTIGIKDLLPTSHVSVNVRSGSSTSTTLLYKTGLNSGYAVLLKKDTKENNFYKIQSDGVLNEDRSAVNSSSGKYDVDKMYAYISADYVTVVRTGASSSGSSTDTISLSKPTLVSAKYNDDAVTVTWKKVTNAKGYYVYRKLSGGTYKKIKTITSGSTVTYKDTSSLTEGKTYVYTVEAYAGTTESSYNSSGVSVKIPKKTYTPYKTTTSVNYRTGPGTSYSKGGSLASGTIIEVEDGYSKSANGYTWYRFKKNSKNYYIASKYVKKLTLSKPTLVSATYANKAVTFKWKKVTNAKGYYVYRKEKGGSYKKIKTITSGSTVSYKDTSTLQGGTTYLYTVRAYYGSVQSGYRTGLSVKIPGVSYTNYVTTTGVNYRTGPGTSYSKGGALAEGKTIQVENGYSKKADGYTWYRFKLNSKNYYIASKYVKKK